MLLKYLQFLGLLWLLLVWIKSALFSGLQECPHCSHGAQWAAFGFFLQIILKITQLMLNFTKFHVFIVVIFNIWFEGIWIFQLLWFFCGASFSPRPLFFSQRCSYWADGNLFSDPVLLVVRLLPEYSHSVFLPTVRNKGHCSLINLSFTG